MSYANPARATEYQREYRRKNIQKRRASSRAWYNQNKDRQRIYRMRSKYGMTPDEILQMEIRQDGLCLICGKRETLCVDHDHETGKVRGLLCKWCNTGLGNFKDSPDFLYRAATYILFHAADFGVSAERLPGGASKSDNSCAPVGWDGLAQAVIANFGVSHANSEQLDALSRFLRTVK